MLAAVYLLLGVAYSLVNPIHEATDELRHYRYVRYIADFGQLPVQSDAEGNAQAHHPPLYYATAALASFWAHPSDPLYEPLHNPQWGFRNWEISTDNKNQYLHGPDEAWPYRDAALAAHIARWVTLLWGAGAVFVTVLIARAVAPERPAVGIVAGSLVALNPMFLYLGAAVNNDVPAGLMGAAITFVCLGVVEQGITDRRSGLLGVLFGLAALVKFNLVGMLAVIELALLLAPLHPTGRRRRLAFLRANAIIGGITLLIAGWWYIRNAMLYGEPTGFLRLTEIWGFRDPGAGVQLAGRELVYAWTSLWARFGYGQIPVPDGFYLIAAILCGAGLLGLISFLVAGHTGRQSQQTLTPAQWRMLAILAASALVNLAILYAYITVSPAGAMGRFFFPGLPALATLAAMGLLILPEGGQRLAAGVIGVGMAIYALAALIGYLAPAYAIPAQAARPADALDIMVGDAARILAYEVTPEKAQPGEAIDVTVTWEVLKPTEQPYAVFVHVISPPGAMVAQRDTYTGLGNYPSNWWRPGHIFTETYRVYIPETAYAPDETVVMIGLYHPELGRLPFSRPDAPNEALQIARLQVEGDPAAEYPNQTFVNWDNHFALIGYTIEPRVLWQGQYTLVTLYWQALNPPQNEAYKVFLHIMEGWDVRWAGNDGNPAHPDITTQTWSPGEIYIDVRELRLPRETPPGIYQIELGWFADSDGHRLNIVAEDGHIIDNWLLLNTITVESNPTFND